MDIGRPLQRVTSKIFQYFLSFGQNHFKVLQKVITKLGSFCNILFQIGVNIISKWDTVIYFKVGQSLFQMVKSSFKVGQLFQCDANYYFKVGHNTLLFRY